MRCVESMSESLNEVDETDLDAISDNDLGILIRDLEAQRAHLDAAHARLVADFDARRAARRLGDQTTAAFLVRTTHCSTRTARRRVRHARRLASMSHTRAAYVRGEIGEDHVARLCGLAGSARSKIKDAFPDAEAGLVEAAKQYSYADFDVLVTYWVNHIDPDGAALSAKDQFASRRLHMSKGLDGSWHIDGFFDAISGEIVHNALARLYDDLFRQDWADAKTRHGDDVSVDDLVRQPAQRRADALVEMAIRAQTAPADGKRPEPMFSVDVGFETAWKDLCQLASGTVIPPGALVPYFTQADIERSIWAPGNRCIELSQQAPFFTGGLRRVIELRDRFCQHPGCNVPAERCQADHNKPKAAGGLTTQDNGRMACGYHNKHKARSLASHRSRPLSPAIPLSSLLTTNDFADGLYPS